MSWLDRPEKKNPNPAKKFLEWSSNDKCFKYYDKQTEENVLVPLPLKFVIVEHYHTVKGWNDASQSGIYSNEVLYTSNDELEVKSFKEGLIAKGLYKEIRQKVNDAGGHYCRSIYAVTKDLELINISLKGSAVSSYSDFIKEFGDYNFDKNWIEISEAKEMKKGAVNYTVPVFNKSSEIKDRTALMPFVEELRNYMFSYLDKKGKNANEIEVNDFQTVNESELISKDDDLPF